MENSIGEMSFMKLLRGGGAAVFLVLLAIPSAYSTTYTVSTTSQLDIVANIAEAGDTIRLQPGNYGSVSMHLPGLGASPITVKPVTRGTVKFVGTVTITGDDVIFDGFEFEGAGKLVLGDLDDSVIKNCVFDDLSSKMWLQLKEGSNKITVEHNSFTNKDNSLSSFCNGGAQLLQIRFTSGTGQLDHKIRWNYFGNIGEGCVDDDINGYETIQIGQSEAKSGRDTDVLIEHNLFEHADGEAEIISVKSSGNTIRYNTFRQSKGSLVFRHGHDNRAEGNIFLGDGVSQTGGIRFQGDNNVIVNNYFAEVQGTNHRAPLAVMDGESGSTPLYDEVNTATVAFNSFIDCSPLVLSADGDGTTIVPEDLRFRNNLLFHTNALDVDFIEVDDPLDSPIFEGNIFYGYGDDLGFTPGTGFQEIDPEVVPLLFDLLGPGVGSPLIDASINSVVTLDVFGRAREGTHDIGAMERTANNPLYGPLSEEDVGPTN